MSGEDEAREIVVSDLTTVHARLVAAMRELTGLAKDQQANFGERYRFRGIDDVYNVVGPIFRTHGLLLRTEALEIHRDTYHTSKGAEMRDVSVLLKVTALGEEGDEVHIATTWGEGADTADKATSKAMSIALKYALFQSLLPPVDADSVEDPDREKHDRAHRQRPQTGGGAKAPPPNAGEAAKRVENQRLTQRKEVIAAATDRVRSETEGYFPGESESAKVAWIIEKVLTEHKILDNDGRPLIQLIPFEQTKTIIEAIRKFPAPPKPSDEAGEEFAGNPALGSDNADEPHSPLKEGPL